jgi:hypothetical protein
MEKKEKDLNYWTKEIHENAVNHGWWEDERKLPEIIALIHSELSESLEHYRNINYYKENNINPNVHIDKNGKPDGIAIELVDVVIRVMDYFGKQGWDLEELIKMKHEYNKNRPYRHGGKKI